MKDALIVSKKEGRVFTKIVHDLSSQKIITENERETLLRTIVISPFNWQLLAQYGFWLSGLCFAIALSLTVASDWVAWFLNLLVSSTDLAKMLLMIGASACFYWWGYLRRASKSLCVFSNECILFLGVVSTAGAVYYLGQVLSDTVEHLPWLLLLSSLLYGVLGYCLRSKMTWIFAFLSLGAWMGAETGYLSGWGVYWLGISYPVRFVLFGGIVVVVSMLLKRKVWFSDFYSVTMKMGLLYLFIALWMLSIFGNFDGECVEVRLIDLFPWVMLFGFVSCLSVYLGLLFHDNLLRSFGLVFLCINLYTRYFEYFWNDMHKVLFFSILGASFWFLGAYAEKIWICPNRLKNKFLP